MAVLDRRQVSLQGLRRASMAVVVLIAGSVPGRGSTTVYAVSNPMASAHPAVAEVMPSLYRANGFTARITVRSYGPNASVYRERTADLDVRTPQDWDVVFHDSGAQGASLSDESSIVRRPGRYAQIFPHEIDLSQLDPIVSSSERNRIAAAFGGTRSAELVQELVEQGVLTPTTLFLPELSEVPEDQFVVPADMYLFGLSMLDGELARRSRVLEDLLTVRSDADGWTFVFPWLEMSYDRSGEPRHSVTTQPNGDRTEVTVDAFADRDAVSPTPPPPTTEFVDLRR